MSARYKIVKGSSSLVTEDRSLAVAYAQANGLTENDIEFLDDSIELQNQLEIHISSLDELVNSIYNKYVPSAGLLNEYQGAEEDALKFLEDPTKKAGRSLVIWANACKTDLSSAAINIKQTAQMLRELSLHIREIRLSAKQGLGRCVRISDQVKIFQDAVKDLNKLAETPF